MSFRLYSIESRKGGVGKTTIALNLAKVLLRKGPVLLLDCDITGTSIAEPASKSIYWRDATNVLMEDGGTPRNLLGYFLSNYIRGNADMNTFIPQDKLFSTKINVIGSQIYGPSPKSIVDTRLLMDEIHSFWLMEYIKSIIKIFVARFEDKGKPIHIIIDNSPGYVGFCQTLHQYMLDLGPETAKYLMVSSVDAQDLQACISASREIETAIDSRFRLTAYYNRLKDGGEKNMDNETLINEAPECRKFFIKLSKDESLLSAYSGEKMAVTQYLSLVLNRVPQFLNSEDIDMELSDIVGFDNVEFFDEITRARNGYPKSVIYYDEAISYQYYYNYLRPRKTLESDAKYDWPRRFRDLRSQNHDLSMYSDRIGAVQKTEGLFRGLAKSLRNQGYLRLLRNIQMTWTPDYVLRRLSLRVSDLRRSFMSNSDVITPHLDNILHEYNMTELNTIGKVSGDLEGIAHLQAIVGYVEQLIGFGKKDSPDIPMLVFSSFLHVFSCIYMQHGEGADIRSFCKKEYQTRPFGRNWKDYQNSVFYVNAEISLDIEPIAVYYQRMFGDFYRNFCYVLMRIIDVHRDFDILLSALELYLPFTGAIGFSKDMIDYLNKVIARKTEEYSEDQLSVIKTNFFAMSTVQSVIRNYVIKSWQ